MTADHTTQAKALEMLRRGYATFQEVADLAGASRQLVRHWAKRADIDAIKARAKFLKAAWKHIRPKR